MSPPDGLPVRRPMLELGSVNCCGRSATAQRSSCQPVRFGFFDLCGTGITDQPRQTAASAALRISARSPALIAVLLYREERVHFETALPVLGSRSDWRVRFSAVKATDPRSFARGLGGRRAGLIDRQAWRLLFPAGGCPAVGDAIYNGDHVTVREGRTGGV